MPAGGMSQQPPSNSRNPPSHKKGELKRRNSTSDTPTTPATYSKLLNKGNKKNAVNTLVDDVVSDSTEDSLYASPLKRSLLNPAKCPCNNSTGDYMIDCSDCHQFWHLNCVSLDGLVKKEVNKLMKWKCPFCYVSPVPTTDTSVNESCFSCRNTRTLRDANCSLETAVAAEKLKTISSFSDVISKIDFESLKNGLTAVQDLDVHMQHLLISKDSLAERQNNIEQIESNLNKISEAVDAKLSQTTTIKSIDSLTEKIQHLDEQLSTFIATPVSVGSSDISATTDKLLDDISKQLNTLCDRPPVFV